MDQQLESIRQDTKQEILALKELIPSSWLFNQLGKAFRPQTLGYWLSNIVLLNLILLGPQTLITVALGEFEKTMPVSQASIIAVEMVILGIIVAHFAAQIMLDDVANHIVEKISNANELSRMLLWFQKSWSIQSIFSFALPFCLLWVVLSMATTSIFLQQFIGLGFTLTYILTGFLAGIALYIPLWTNSMVVDLKNYQYEMNAFSPADSEILSDISEMLTKGTYLQAAVLGMITLVGTSSLVNQQFRVTFSLPMLAFAWIAIIAQFLLTRSTLGTITNRAKWKTLNKIQAKINLLEGSGDLSDKDTVERLLRLADVHRQILASKTSTLDLKSFSTLFSQLMLPLLGLLLGNLDKVSKILGK